MAALVGWMPSAIDVSVWQSLWTLARGEETGRARRARARSAFDFYVGYLGHGDPRALLRDARRGGPHGGGEPSRRRPGASRRRSSPLYARTLGGWSRPLIGAAAFATMFSTTLTVVDGFPRALAVLVDRFRGPEEPGEPRAPIARGLLGGAGRALRRLRW